MNIGSPSAAIQNISNQNISNQNISNADPAIQNISNQNISNQNISNQNISNQNISNLSPAMQNISNQNISNQNISNTTAANQNISNQNISNQNISNQNISNTPITDATYAMTNVGNTTHSYRVALYGNNATGKPLQVIVTKNSSTPVAVGCTLQSLPQSAVLARSDGAPVASSLTGAGSATDPNIPGASNTTVSIGPGETMFVTVRGALSPDEMTALTHQLTPVITAHGANTNGVANDFAALLFIQTSTGGLSPATVGILYSATLHAAGGKSPLTWSKVSGFPSWLSLSSDGVLSGTPDSFGPPFDFTVQVADSSTPPQKLTQKFSLTVNGRKTTTSVSFGTSPVTVGQATSVNVTVADTDAETPSSPTGSVTLSGDPGLSAPSCDLVPSGTLGISTCPGVTLTPLSVGPRTISATYSGDSLHAAATQPTTATLTVNQAATSITTPTSSLNPSMSGQAVTFTAIVTTPVVGVPGPTGAVTFKDGATALGTSNLSGNAATFTTSTLSVGSHSITAAYGGAPNFSPSTSGTLTQVVNMPPYTFTGFLSPISTAGSLTSPTNSGTGNFSKGLPIKWQLKDPLGNFVTSLTSTQTLKATYYGAACGSGQATGTTFTLYLPTTGATGGSTFRYDSSNNQYLFNWSTKSATTGPGCYEIILKLNDGSPEKATQIKLQ